MSRAEKRNNKDISINSDDRFAEIIRGLFWNLLDMEILILTPYRMVKVKKR